jgi:hypothetical protein
MPSPQNITDPAFASHDDIRAVLGNIDSAKMLAIFKLRPTVAELEAALLWLEGDADVYDAGEPLKGAAADIVSILTEGEDEDEVPGVT